MCSSSTRFIGSIPRSKKCSIRRWRTSSSTSSSVRVRPAKSVKIPIAHFTLIGATTRAGLLTSPLRSRFGIVHRLDFYTEDDLERVVLRSAAILGVADRAGGGARHRPPVARDAPHREPPAPAGPRLSRRSRADGAVTEKVAQDALTLLEVDEMGFDEMDRSILFTLMDKFSGAPVGLSTVAAVVGEEPDTIEDVYEPYLIQIGFLDRTPRGRVATERAYRHFGFTPSTRKSACFDPAIRLRLRAPSRAHRADAGRRAGWLAPPASRCRRNRPSPRLPRPAGTPRARGISWC